MPREVIEYRIVCMEPDGPTKQLSWSRDRAFTELCLKAIRGDGPNTTIYEEVYMERRTVTYGEPERVMQMGDGN